MSTPPISKPPKRFSHTYSSVKASLPSGDYVTGIGDPDIAREIGVIMGRWTHIEERMIWVFQQVLGLKDKITARQVFRSIINQKTRLEIMRNLLERSPLHQKTEKYFDDVINEFAALNSLRNTYVHSLYWTEQSGEVYIEEVKAEFMTFLTGRKVTLNELRAMLDRMNELSQKLLKREMARPDA